MTRLGQKKNPGVRQLLGSQPVWARSSLCHSWLRCVLWGPFVVSMVDVFSGRLLISKDGRSVDPDEALQNKVVGLYFSAGWCSPCRDFTPVLCDFYTELLEETQPPPPFEVVFISSDHSAEEMAGYMRAMHGNWLALPFHDPYKQ